jgi:hypothetical protein
MRNLEYAQTLAETALRTAQAAKESTFAWMGTGESFCPARVGGGVGDTKTCRVALVVGCSCRSCVRQYPRTPACASLPRHRSHCPPHPDTLSILALIYGLNASAAKAQPLEKDDEEGKEKNQEEKQGLAARKSFDGLGCCEGW